MTRFRWAPKLSLVLLAVFGGACNVSHAQSSPSRDIAFSLNGTAWKLESLEPATGPIQPHPKEQSDMVRLDFGTKGRAYPFFSFHDGCLSHSGGFYSIDSNRLTRIEGGDSPAVDLGYQCPQAEFIGGFFQSWMRGQPLPSSISGTARRIMFTNSLGSVTFVADFKPASAGAGFESKWTPDLLGTWKLTTVRDGDRITKPKRNLTITMTRQTLRVTDGCTHTNLTFLADPDGAQYLEFSETPEEWAKPGCKPTVPRETLLLGLYGRITVEQNSNKRTMRFDGGHVSLTYERSR